MICDRCGKAPATQAISRIENGKYSGNIATFVRYLNLLGLSLQSEVSSYPALEDLDNLFNEGDDD